ncbi:MAG: hypothetical protein U9N14_06460 [Pseudomonadota bacterium]|nr:hypothetical protein [Pseudomonadota bacterium]
MRNIPRSIDQLFCELDEACNRAAEAVRSGRTDLLKHPAMAVDVRKARRDRFRKFDSGTFEKVFDAMLADLCLPWRIADECRSKGRKNLKFTRTMLDANVDGPVEFLACTFGVGLSALAAFGRYHLSNFYKQNLKPHLHPVVFEASGLLAGEALGLDLTADETDLTRGVRTLAAAEDYAFRTAPMIRSHLLRAERWGFGAIDINLPLIDGRWVTLLQDTVGDSPNYRATATMLIDMIDIARNQYVRLDGLDQPFSANDMAISAILNKGSGDIPHFMRSRDEERREIRKDAVYFAGRLEKFGAGKDWLESDSGQAALSALEIVPIDLKYPRCSDGPNFHVD